MILFNGKGGSFNVNQSENSKSEISPCFSQTQIIGHGTNTAALFERYKTDGLKFVECDLIKTSDEVFILGHNNSETFNGEVLNLSEMTYDEIVQKGYPAEKLENLILKCKKFNMCLYLDIKFGNTSSDECLTNLYKMIEKYSMLQSVVFGSLSLQKKTVLSRLNSNLIFDTPMHNLNALTGSLPTLELGKLIIGHISASGTSPQEMKEVIETAHEKGFKIYPWTVGTKEAANEWLNVGADFVMCNAGVANSDII